MTSVMIPLVIRLLQLLSHRLFLLPLAIFIIFYCAWNFFFHPLAKIPGPLSARLGIPTFRALNASFKTYSWNHKAFHDKYGDVVRLGPNIVTTIDPEAIRTIYAYGSDFHKTKFYPVFAAIQSKPSLFSNISPHSHASGRRSVARVYSPKSLIELEEYMGPCIQQLLQQFDRIASVTGEKKASHRPVEINKWLHYFAADTIGELAFGSGFGLLQKGDASSLLRALTNLSYFGCISGALPGWVAPLINTILRRTSPDSPSVISAQTWERVNKRYKLLAEAPYDESVRHDMLDGFMKAKYPGTNTLFSPPDVVAQATSVFGAGSDTTAGAMTGFFYYVLTHPIVYECLQAEVDSAFEAGRMSIPVSYAQGVKLEYLQACIKEAVRLFTPIGMELPRIVPEGGMMVGRHFLPAGTHVGANPFVFHRTEHAYGSDAELFQPERWLHISEEVRGMMERNFLSFGSGSRVCLGKNIPFMEMSKLLPTLLWRYTFSIIPRSKGSPHRTALGRTLDGIESKDAPGRVNSHWFLTVDDFWCDITLRKPDVSFV